MSTNGLEELRDGGRGSDPYTRIAKLARALEKYKILAGNAIEERDVLVEKLEEMQKVQEKWDVERKELEAKADANIERSRADKLQQQIRDIRHRDMFYKQARSAGAPSDVVEDLWNLAGFKADKDEVNEVAMQELVDRLKESKPRWFEERKAQDVSGQLDTEDASRKLGPSTGRGEGIHGPRGKTYSTDDLHDAKKAMDPEFMKEYNIAYKEGRVQRVGLEARL